MLLEIAIIRVSLYILGALLTLALLLEGILRFVFGLGNPLIYRTDDNIGYFLAPNQKTRRFGNRIEINQYSQRSKPINIDTSPNTLRILFLGDSIVNGGWWTTQDDTIPYLIEKQLSEHLSHPVETLNASANSWGPRNELAYLRRFGTFQAEIVILILNTDDLFALAPSGRVVGKDLNYPDRTPPLALLELYDKYFKKYPSLEPIEEKGDRVAKNLEAIENITEIARQKDIEPIIALTPLIREVKGEGREYEKKARERLENLTRTLNITYIDFLPVFQKIDPAGLLYRDNIHLSPRGNEIVRDKLTETILDQKLP